MNANLMLVVVCADANAGAEFVMANPDVPYFCLVNRERWSMAWIGNAQMDFTDKPVFGLCHADCTFGPDALAVFTQVALSGKVCGTVGVNMGREYIWGKDIPEAFEVRDISTLDSCCVFFRRDLGLRFDEQTFDGFHCHVEDLCLQAHAKGIPVVVPAAKADHVGGSTADPVWQKDYRFYRSRLAEKWKGTRFETT